MNLNAKHNINKNIIKLILCRFTCYERKKTLREKK